MKLKKKKRVNWIRMTHDEWFLMKKSHIQEGIQRGRAELAAELRRLLDITYDD